MGRDVCPHNPYQILFIQYLQLIVTLTNSYYNPVFPVKEASVLCSVNPPFDSEDLMLLAHIGAPIPPIPPLHALDNIWYPLAISRECTVNEFSNSLEYADPAPFRML